MKVTYQNACFAAPWIPRWVRLDGKVIGECMLDVHDKSWNYLSSDKTKKLNGYSLNNLAEKIINNQI